MNKAQNECTCPSGDGSLVHPCPAHPAVEQAGGDERVIGWRERILAAHPNSNPGFWTDALLVEHMAAEIEDLRAALAQPSPVRSSLLINGYQLRAALDFIAPDGTAEQLESEACIEWRQQDADFLEAGLYAFCAEYPEEGGVLLDEEPTTAQPSPLQSEQAEAEQPEVVAWQYRVTAGPQTGWSLWHPGKGEEFERSYTVERRPLMTVAQHERIVGALRFERQQMDRAFAACINERDAALARVAELERQEPVAAVSGETFSSDGTSDIITRNLPIGTKLYAAPVAQAQQLNDLDKQCRDDVARALGLRPNQERGFAWSYLLASIKSCVKASGDSAQAQHSVPEASEQEKEQGWTLDYRFVERVTELAASRTEYTTSMEATEQVLLAALELLAAAPGKEVGHE
ncbi:hypothetical protein SOJ71_02040 [Pseudomonas aeruginosa]|uniref:hypothetical protein n=1 Tax=Pseudomonas aeruginosa TaxID=287 RepID=UPI002A6B5EB9|nr:hypothetical protein [Pseudomonas aeruginosa]MDY1039759.1 hypothetical protein [Pseudomonas aeruginosa]